MDFLKQLDPTILAIMAAILGIIIAKLADRLLKRHDDISEELKANTLAITELRVEVKHLREIIADHFKLRQDVNVAHERIREIQRSINGPQTP